MPELLKLCDTCIHSPDYRKDPASFQPALERFAESGFVCLGKPVVKCENPFAVPLPDIRRMCSLDAALSEALKAKGYPDTPKDNTARTAFLSGELELHPVIEGSDSASGSVVA